MEVEKHMEATVDTVSRIREFVRTQILFGDEAQELSDASPLLQGAVDSLGLMQLVAFLEEEFDIEIDDGDITEENFRTIADIGHYVEQAGRA
ncbi:MAG: acyl carrier protein [Actinomycetota bacterium]